ncbi:hypothetical protein [Curtobacterium flaccumfaciens]|uniref:hypothetical protein n=1 Tax=Curtobacterium flaccumfaciens TaxID=2035 RepID=UPI001889CE4A|nr:hypothetical protein [Curtobacterium flaccumfaciens]MBF4629571.1 hypothetical protein [Curtobacterium flaccumfaciens]
MYLRLEKLWRGQNDEWITAPELINLDQVTRLWVTKDQANTSALFELNVTLTGGVGTLTYYFGPGDMTAVEQGKRFERLYAGIERGYSSSWTKVQDDVTRAADEHLDYENVVS